MGPMHYIGLDVHKQKISYCMQAPADLPFKNFPRNECHPP